MKEKKLNSANCVWARKQLQQQHKKQQQRIKMKDDKGFAQNCQKLRKIKIQSDLVVCWTLYSNYLKYVSTN